MAEAQERPDASEPPLISTPSLSASLQTGGLISTAGSLETSLADPADPNAAQIHARTYNSNGFDTDTLRNGERSLPDPNKVLRRSLLIPGWGQVTNKQAWKVPIVYGLLGGLTYYSIYLNKKYHDYRAAYYNLNPDITGDDQRFGPTPSYIPENANLQSLRQIRNGFRNRRDFVYISIGLAYGLNAIDAYVFAHMRSFDVSEDLSVRTKVQPAVMENGNPGFTLSLQLFNHSKAE